MNSWLGHLASTFGKFSDQLSVYTGWDVYTDSKVRSAQIKHLYQRVTDHIHRGQEQMQLPLPITHGLLKCSASETGGAQMDQHPTVQY